MNHLDENTIDLFLQGGLTTAPRAEVERHLAACPACRRLVSELVQVEPRSVAATARAQDTLTIGRHPSAAPEPSSPIFRIGQCVADRYRILRFVAEGGMGEVYEAEDLELQSRVALKTVRPEIAADQRVLARFRREIFFARKVTHPNVCRIFDLGFHLRGERIAFLTMEFLDGETLTQRIRRMGRLSPQEALPIVAQMTAGLAAAHAVEVIHRDFKSQNVMLVRQGEQLRVVVTDFGLARGSSGSETAGESSTVGSGLVGSPAYMAPEQVAGQRIDLRVDVYALGVVLYEMVTGNWPFVAETPMLTAVKRLQENPVSPRIHVPGLALAWEQVILRCLARDPAARFGSVSDVAVALRSSGGATDETTPASVRTAGSAFFVAGPDARSLPASVIRASAGSAGRRMAGWQITAGLLVAAAISAGVGWRLTTHSQLAPPKALVPAAAAEHRAALEVKADPPTARITLDGELVPNPFATSQPTSTEPHLLETSSPGYQTDRQQVVFERDQSLSIRLQPQPPKPPRRAAKTSRRQTEGAKELITSYPE